MADKGGRFALTPVILAGLLFLLCVVIYPAQRFSDMQAGLFRIVVFLALAAAVWSADKWISMFMVLAVISLVSQNDYMLMIKGDLMVVHIKRLGASGLNTLNFISLAVAWYLIIVYRVPHDKIHYLLNAICLLALANVLYQGVQWMKWDYMMVPRGQHWTSTYNPLVGFMGNRMHTSALLAMSIPAFLRGRWLWGVPVVLVGLLMAKSVGGIVALGIGLTFYGLMWVKNPWSIVPFLICIIVGGGIMIGLLGRGADYRSRLEVWQNVIPFFKQNWWLGSGIGNWKVLFSIVSPYRGLRWTKAHNDVIQAVFEMGPLFLVILAGFTWNIVKTVYRATDKRFFLLPLTALVIILADAQVNFLFHIPQLAVVAVTWLAIFKVKERCSH